MDTMNFSATIEYIPGQLAAIIELTDSRGEWAGGGRIEVRPINGDVRGALYEAGYNEASARATAKGGRLDRYREFEATRPRRVRPVRSPALAVLPVGAEACRFSPDMSAIDSRRRANALNIEWFGPSRRCLLKLPEHWTGTGASALRWLASGGSPMVFGPCSPRACPKARP